MWCMRISFTCEIYIFTIVWKVSSLCSVLIEHFSCFFFCICRGFSLSTCWFDQIRTTTLLWTTILWCIKWSANMKIIMITREHDARRLQSLHASSEIFICEFRYIVYTRFGTCMCSSAATSQCNFHLKPQTKQIVGYISSPYYTTFIHSTYICLSSFAWSAIFLSYLFHESVRRGEQLIRAWIYVNTAIDYAQVTSSKTHICILSTNT